MHAAFGEQADKWEGWAFGDLVVAAYRAVEVVGPSADVESLSVSLGPDGVPQVMLLVFDNAEVGRLREVVQHGEFPAQVVNLPPVPGWGVDDRWGAAVHGMLLHVAIADPPDCTGLVEIFVRDDGGAS